VAISQNIGQLCGGSAAAPGRDCGIDPTGFRCEARIILRENLACEHRKAQQRCCPER
jgi:hypothetical protein